MLSESKKKTTIHPTFITNQPTFIAHIARGGARGSWGTTVTALRRLWLGAAWLALPLPWLRPAASSCVIGPSFNLLRRGPRATEFLSPAAAWMAVLDSPS